MITVVVGTNRPGSMSRRLANEVERIYRADLQLAVRVLDLGALPSEIFSPRAYEAKPASFSHWSESVTTADGLVFVVPEYNGGMPGVLKYFIDMLPFPASLEHKPVCTVGLADGQWGALRAVEQLQQICRYRHAHVYPISVLIPRVTLVFDADGLRDREIAHRLAQQAAGFAAFCASLQRPAPTACGDTYLHSFRDIEATD